MVTNNSLGLIGINHRSSSVIERELISSSESLYRSFQLENVEHAIISTCNRTELVYNTEAEKFPALKEYIENKFLSFLPEVFRSKTQNKSPLYNLQNEGAVSHFFKVASGLDSMVIGEAEILGQIKKAYQEAVSLGKINSILHRLFQTAFRTAKEVRSTTGIGRGKVSVASTAVQAIKNVFGDLSEQKVLIIGAGETGTLLGRHLLASGAKQFFVANRSQAGSKKLVDVLNAVYLPLDKIRMILPSVTIVVAAVNTDINSYILKLGLVSDLLKSQARKTYCMVDLSVPRVIEPEIKNLNSVYLFNVDDLSHLVESNKLVRMGQAERATDIINFQVAEFNLWHQNRRQDALIQQLFSRFNQVSEKEKVRIQKCLISQSSKRDSDALFLERSFDSISRKLFDPLLRGYRSGEISEEEVRLFLKCLGTFDLKLDR